MIARKPGSPGRKTGRWRRPRTRNIFNWQTRPIRSTIIVAVLVAVVAAVFAIW